ncbi:hypothetical protein K2P96_01730, partial [Patescibacteria group bacterium]|nr:hypothetical protein [Patescibacteria group bacterium]
MEEEKLIEQFKTSIEKIKEVKMTALERDAMLKNIYSAPIPSPFGIKNPYLINIFTKIEQNRFVYVVAPCLIVFILTGSALAAQRSLPGDALYSLKVHILEPAYSSVLVSPIKKAEYASLLADKRLVEAETLAKENKLDDSK